MDNLDRLILGYLSQHPYALYSEIAQSVDCSKSVLPHRISQLLNDSFLSCDKTSKLIVTNTGLQEAVLLSNDGISISSQNKFSWDFLYIPTRLE